MTKRMQREQSSDSLQSKGTKPITSSATALIQIAAYRIDLPQGTLDRILDRLREECIKEEWQLKFMDSYNWQSLGAPIGLVAAVRSCLQDKATSSCTCCSYSSSSDRFVSDETPNFVTATQISRPTSQTMLSSSPAAPPRAPELKARHSVPTIFPTRPSDDAIPTSSTDSMAPEIPARRNTILVDDELFAKLNALEIFDSFAAYKSKDFLSPPQIPQRRMSSMSGLRQNVSRQNTLSMSSIDIGDVLENDDDDAIVEKLCGSTQNELGSGPDDFESPAAPAS